jgi:hypothetical protein
MSTPRGKHWERLHASSNAIGSYHVEAVRPLVSGSVLGNVATRSTLKERTMEGVGKHHTTTGALWCPNDPVRPWFATPKRWCFSEPVVGTHTPLLLENWSCAAGLQHAARERDGFLTTGLTRTRCWLRAPDESVPEGWRWQQRSEYVVSVSTQASCHMS